MPLRLILTIAALVAAGPAFAQDATPTQDAPVAAARLPDAFADETPPAVLAAERARVARAEEALRRQIAALQDGRPAYGDMTEGLSAALRPQAEEVSRLLAGFGEVESIRHAGVENGAELFLVVFAEAQTQWIIGLNSEGKVGALLFRPAPEA